MNRHRLPFARPIAVTAAIAVWFTGLACMATCLFGCHARAATPPAPRLTVNARKKVPHCTRACCRKSAEDRASHSSNHSRTISGTTDPDSGEFCPLAGKRARFITEREIAFPMPALIRSVHTSKWTSPLPAEPVFFFRRPISGRGSGTHLRLCVFRI